MNRPTCLGWMHPNFKSGLPFSFLSWRSTFKSSMKWIRTLYRFCSRNPIAVLKNRTHDEVFGGLLACQNLKKPGLLKVVCRPIQVHETVGIIKWAYFLLIILLIIASGTLPTPLRTWVATCHLCSMWAMFYLYVEVYWMVLIIKLRTAHASRQFQFFANNE